MHDRIKVKKNFIKGLRDYHKGATAEDLKPLRKPKAPIAAGGKAAPAVHPGLDSRGHGAGMGDSELDASGIAHTDAMPDGDPDDLSKLPPDVIAKLLAETGQ